MSFYNNMSDEDLHDFFTERIYARYKSAWATRLGNARQPVPFRGNVYGFAATSLEKMLSFQYWEEGKRLAAETFGTQDSLPDVYILGPIKRIFKGCIWAMERDLMVPEGFMDKETVNRLTRYLTMESFLSEAKRESLYAASKTLRETYRAKKVMTSQTNSMELATLINFMTNNGMGTTTLSKVVQAFSDSIFCSVIKAVGSQCAAQQALNEQKEDPLGLDDCD